MWGLCCCSEPSPSQSSGYLITRPEQQNHRGEIGKGLGIPYGSKATNGMNHAPLSNPSSSSYCVWSVSLWLRLGYCLWAASNSDHVRARELAQACMEVTVFALSLEGLESRDRSVREMQGVEYGYTLLIKRGKNCHPLLEPLACTRTSHAMMVCANHKFRPCCPIVHPYLHISTCDCPRLKEWRDCAAPNTGP